MKKLPFQKIKDYLFEPRIKLNEIEFNLVAIFFIVVGLGLGLYLTSTKIIPLIFASGTSSKTIDTDTDFNYGTYTSTNISGTGTAAVVKATPTGPHSTTYKRVITINNSGSTQSNYEIKLTLDTASLITAGKMKSDCTDIYFQTSGNTDITNYWVANCNNSSTEIWVKIPTLSNGSNTINLYYGSSTSNSNTSSASNTFESVVTGLKSAYSFDETNGTFADSSGSGNTATAHGTSSTTGNFSNGVLLNGTFSDYITTANSYASPTEFTIDLWFKTANGYSSGGRIAGFGTNQSSNSGFTQPPYDDRQIYMDDSGHIVFGVSTSNGGSSATTISSSSTYNDGNWHHVISDIQDAGCCGTYYIHINIDGSNQSSGSLSNPSFLSYTGYWELGGDSLNGETSQPSSRFFGGTIDEARIYHSSMNTITGNEGQYSGTGYYDYVTTNNSVANEGLIVKYSSSVGSSSVGSESTTYPSSSNWASSGSGSGLIDFVWNGGWGDISDSSSTAFSADISNATSDATITFRMKVAGSTSDLASASYVTLGTATSGSTFTKTGAQMTALLSTGTNRYAQVSFVYSINSSATNTPSVDKITINYTPDGTPPSLNASSLSMFSTSGGSSVSQSGWTNNTGPYFTWTAGTDADAGIKGYCMYLGTNSAGDPADINNQTGNSGPNLLASSTSHTDVSGGTTISGSTSNCPFIASSTKIDFSDTSYRGSNGWLTTSTSPYYLNIKAIDNANNTYATSLQFQFYFDNASPSNPSYLKLPTTYSNTKAVTFSWPNSGSDAASDAASGVAGVQYRIGANGTWEGTHHSGSQDFSDILANSDGSYTFNSTNDFSSINDGDVNNGVTTIYLRTWDNAGNVSSTVISSALYVSTISPTSPQSLSVSPTQSTTSNSFSFSWSKPSSVNGDATKITYCYSVNNIPSSVSDCTFTSAGVTTLSADHFATKHGTNTLYLVARDEAGNIFFGSSNNSSWYASVNFTYNGPAPGIPLNVGIGDISVKASKIWRLVITWQPPENTDTIISTYDLYRSTTGGSCTGYTKIGSTSGLSYLDTSVDFGTKYYYCVRAHDTTSSDPTNGVSAASSIVSDSPTGKYTSAANITSNPVISSITTTKATITWTTDRNSSSSIEYGTSSNDYNTEQISNSTQTTNHSITLTNLKPGTIYFFRSLWTDEDGNTGTSSETTFTTAPPPSVQDVNTLQIGLDYALIQFTATGASSVNLYYGTNTDFGTIKKLSTSPVESTYTTELLNLQDGTKYYYKINSVDSDGNEYQGTILSFNTIPRPKISNVKILEIKNAPSTSIQITWDSNTPISSIISYIPSNSIAKNLEQVDINLLKGSHKMVVSDLLSNQSYTLIIKGRDNIGNEAISETQQFTTSIDTRPPSISNIDIQSSSAIRATGINQESISQLVISWDTDEPSTSQVQYGEGTGTTYSQSSSEDSSLTVNHLVIINNLSPSKVYHLSVISNDKDGNKSQSSDQVTITAKSTDSTLDLITSSIKDIFGL